MSRIVTLKYAESGSCICSPTATAFVQSLCPRHGHRDFLTKQPSEQARDFGRAEEEEANRQPLRTPPHSNEHPPQVFNAPSDMTDSLECLLDVQRPSVPYRRPARTRRRRPLTSIDFLHAPPEFRHLIYRYLLVSTSGSIFFPRPDSPDTIGAAGSDIQPSILYLNRQVYSEGVKILYGENKFVAPDPSHLFLPNGLQGLRRRTISLIRHLGFEKTGFAMRMHQETSAAVYQPIWWMMLDYPGFLTLKKITIRREVIRPIDLNIFTLQMLLAEQGGPADAPVLYKKKNLVMHVAGKLAFKVATRGADFRGLFIVDDSEFEVRTPKEFCLSNVIEVCLTREDGVRDMVAGEQQDLSRIIQEALFDEKDAGMPGAEQAYSLWLQRYRRERR